MSVTLEVYPKLSKIPSFRELLELSRVRLSEYLIDNGISAHPVIKVDILSEKDDEPRSFDMNAPAMWSDGEYAWFYIEPAPGGTDAYFCSNQEFGYEYMDGEIETHILAAERKTLIYECLANDYHWMFRRSAGQPAIINVGYGMIAGSLAELTEGFIYSIDSAWDYDRFPATAEEFFSCYFRPDKAIHPDHADWAARCIKHLAEELKT
jgi:hypothetical protein